jgi:hypothetical protein
MKILMGDFNAKVGREDIFKPIISNEILHERVVNFATSKNLIVESITFPHREIHEHTWNSNGVTYKQIDSDSTDKRRH